MGAPSYTRTVESFRINSFIHTHTLTDTHNDSLNLLIWNNNAPKGAALARSHHQRQRQKCHIATVHQSCSSNNISILHAHLWYYLNECFTSIEYFVKGFWIHVVNLLHLNKVKCIGIYNIYFIFPFNKFLCYFSIPFFFVSIYNAIMFAGNIRVKYLYYNNKWIE